MVKRKKIIKHTEDDAELDPSSRSFIYDEVDDFHDAEDNDMYDEIPEVITKESSKEQVLGIGSYSSGESDDDDDDDDDNELLESDIQSPHESSDDDDDDRRTMGKKKRNYFGTDLTDQRIHKASKHKAKKKDDSVQLEIEGAKQMQDRMRKEVELVMFSSFSSQPLHTKAKKEEEAIPGKMKEIELNSGSIPKSKALKKKKKIAEFSPMDDFKEKAKELSSKLCPLIDAKKKGLLPTTSATEYLQTRYLLCLNYLNVVSAYMMVKYSGVKISDHPAESRLAQYRHLFKEMEPCELKYDLELDALLLDLKSGKLKSAKAKMQRKMLGVVKGTIKEKERVGSNVLPDARYGGEEEIEAEQGRGEERQRDEMSSGEEENVREGEGNKASLKEDSRRVITYEISKNKGLLPTRKKEQRNPRVKYKKKYQNKLKRRKGQVREVRKEIERYSGEISGIKANVIKSIKLK